MLTVSALNVYPVKACRGSSRASVVLDRRGLENDRRWLVVDEAGRFLTQRELPRMALIEPDLVDGGLRLSAPGMPSIDVRIDGSRGERDVTVWGFRGAAEDEGDAPARWLSEFLTRSCRLVRFDESVTRAVDERYSAEGEVRFADAFPILVVSQASLDALNERLDSPVPMDRFRPNLVIAGAEPHSEDGWRRILVGDVAIDLVKPCDRCSVPSVDQTTGVRGREPLRTLAGYRKRDGKIYFGQNGVHCSTGVLRVGDPVVVEPR